MFNILPRRAWEPVPGEEGVDVGGQDKAEPVDDRLADDGSAETARFSNDPCGEDTAARTARDEEAILVNVALGDDGVDARHQVLVIVPRIGVVNQIAELLAITRAAARIG